MTWVVWKLLQIIWLPYLIWTYEENIVHSCPETLNSWNLVIQSFIFWNEPQFLVNHKQNPISNVIIIILVMSLKSLFCTVHNVPCITRFNKIQKWGASPSVINGNKIQSNFTKELIIVAVISPSLKNFILENWTLSFLWIDMRRVNPTTQTPLSGTITITGPLYSRLEPRY